MAAITEGLVPQRPAPPRPQLPSTSKKTFSLQLAPSGSVPPSPSSSFDSSSSSSSPASPLTDKDPTVVNVAPLKVPVPKKGPPPPQKPSRSNINNSPNSINSNNINNINTNGNNTLHNINYASSSYTSTTTPQQQQYKQQQSQRSTPHDSLRSNHSDTNLNSNSVYSSSPKSTYSRHHNYDPSEYSSNRSTFKGVFSNIVSSMS
ncbi:hypothetical protein BGZ52_010735, partial [Haplosporangium bisporale]